MLLALLLALGNDALPDDVTVALKPDWTVPLGASYSRVAVRENHIVTQYGDGTTDYVVGMNPDGSTRWRHPLGPVYLGHDGSEDGPISTPVMDDTRAFALGPRGRLVSLDLDSGEPQWSVHLVDDLGAKAPEYGFTTTPVLEGEILVLQAGGSDGRNLCGLDVETGEVLWSLGDGKAGYQSPVVLELAGRRQLVVLNGKEILSVAPATGELLWTHALGERSSASMGSAAAIDDSRFYLSVSGQIAVFRVTAKDDGYSVEELLRTRELGSTHAKPVYHEGHLYGFKSSFLTCVNALSGRRVWKSRPPGGNALVLVGDRLVVFGAEGVLAVVRATPDAYIEESRIKALEHSGFTWPSVAEDRVFVRNSEQLVCLQLVQGGTGAVTMTEPDAPPSDHAFGLFLRELEAIRSADERKARIDAFLGEQNSIPIVEGDVVHFVYRGEAQDVAVVGSMTGDQRADALYRALGTDFYHRSYAIEPGARWQYSFQVDFQSGLLDPLNPRTTPGHGKPVSELVTPTYPAPTHTAEPAATASRMESHEFTSKQLGNTRTIQVYLPAGYDQSETRHPLLVVHDGPDWLQKGNMKNSLDNLLGKSVKPLVVAFVPPMRSWWFEAGGSQTEEYIAMLATEFVPYLDAQYRLSDDAADRALAGVRGFGLTSAFGVVAHPDVFGKAGVQSVSFEDVARHAFFEQLSASPPRDAVFYVDWNRYEYNEHDKGYDYRAYGTRLMEALRSAGVTVHGGEALDCHGWGSWSSRTDDLLVALFPLE